MARTRGRLDALARRRIGAARGLDASRLLLETSRVWNVMFIYVSLYVFPLGCISPARRDALELLNPESLTAESLARAL